MANAYTDTTAMGNLVQTAYDRLVEFALRSQPLFRSVADKRPAQQAMPGSSVVLERYKDLAQQTADPTTSALSEDVDPDSIALGNPDQVTITLREYGAAVLRSRKLNLFSLSDVDPAIANIVAYNLIDSVDAKVQEVLRAGTNVIRENAGAMLINAGTLGAVAATDVFKSRDARAAVTKLRANKAVPKKGNLYWAAIHPEVSYDLRSETGDTGWRQPHDYSAPGSIWAGEVGQYEGAFFVETPRAFVGTDDGSANTNVYRTYFAGQQALAEAVAEDFHVVVGPVTDKLMRARPIGWYGVAGWARYREEALYRVETSSSLGNNGVG